MSRAVPERLRGVVLERDDWTCRYCATRPEPMWEWHSLVKRWMCNMHVDHVIPRVQGGDTTMDNLVACCAPCNLRKYDQFWVPLGWNL